MFPYKNFFNMKIINFYIILFVSFSVFKFNSCQKIIRDLNPTRNLDENVDEEPNVIEECKNNPTPELCKDPYGFYACYFSPNINNKECFNNIIIVFILYYNFI